ncbi:MAG: ABC transporter permease [Chloroflexi bacterium]|nr:ABC transporter permease [Chloroflexota bacterium]
MTQYITRRVLISIPLLFGISVITFLIINMAPGDPLTALLNPEDQLSISVRDVEELRRRLGLDRPGPVRYAIWLKEALTGNLGYSYQTKRPVIEMIIEKLPVTISLMGTALALAVSIGVVFGVLSALRQYSIIDYSLSVVSFFMISIPQFFFALSGMLIFAVWLGWLPVFGMWTAGRDPQVGDVIRHAILPISALMLQDIAVYMRYTRASMLDTLSAEYVLTARAKGLSETLVLWKHVFRNALVPLVTVLGLSLPALIGGALIIETIFSWPGVGSLAYTSLLQRDYPVQMAVLLMGATAVLAANLLTDVAYAWVDPRVRHS